jgi:hypothetical protein
MDEKKDNLDLKIETEEMTDDETLRELMSLYYELGKHSVELSDFNPNFEFDRVPLFFQTLSKIMSILDKNKPDGLRLPKRLIKDQIKKCVSGTSQTLYIFNESLDEMGFGNLKIRLNPE